jgi:hypothetical protein
MTEEERQKTILELEKAVCKSIPKREPAIKRCECCGDPLVGGECRDHPSYMRMHRAALNKIRKQYD